MHLLKQLWYSNTRPAPNRLPLRHARHRRSPVILVLLILLWSVSLGLGVAWATDSSEIGTVDPVPQRYQLGQELYLENCATCHVGVPPAVLPSETWRQLLEDPTQHYSTRLPPIVDPPRLLMWDYLRTFSRPTPAEEPVPYRVNDSRYFKALHPKVDLPRPVRLDSCVSCHPGASQFNYRRLSPEWETVP
ncbi:diheme cytochrome C [Oculatella sp. LEGE 06141]|nr:diheme cytochrome C [Oculatella sp. LEGE 06141]